MRASTAIVLGAIAILVMLFVSARPGPDSQVPPRLGPYVEPARQIAQPKAGLPASLTGVRLAETRCAADGSVAVLTFEGAGKRAYALIAFPPTQEATEPGAATTIVGLTEAEYKAQAIAPTLAVAC